jgi:hypothetical protein
MFSMLKRLLFWLRIEAPQKRIDAPPKRYYRCGTMLMRSSPEGQKRIIQRWQEEDDRFVAWVEAHPRPKKEWLEVVHDIRKDD